MDTAISRQYGPGNKGVVWLCFVLLGLYTDTETSFWWNFHLWLHWKLSIWQLPVQTVMKISSKCHFHFSDSIGINTWIRPPPDSMACGIRAWFGFAWFSWGYTLTQKCHFDEIFITGCTWSCQNDNFQCKPVMTISSKCHFHYSGNIEINTWIEPPADSTARGMRAWFGFAFVLFVLYSVVQSKHGQYWSQCLQHTPHSWPLRARYGVAFCEFNVWSIFYLKHCIAVSNIVIYFTMWPRQNGCHFPDNIFKCIFLNENVWIAIEISLKFVPKGQINSITALIQMTAWCRPGDKPLSQPTRTTRTPVFWGYPRRPMITHDTIDSYWIPTKQDKVRVTNLTNLPKVQIF